MKPTHPLVFDDGFSALDPVACVVERIFVSRPSGPQSGRRGFDNRSAGERTRTRLYPASDFGYPIGIGNTAVLENEFRILGETLTHLVVNPSNGKPFRAGRYHEVSDSLSNAHRGVRPRDEGVKLGNSAVADEVLHPVQNPMIALTHGSQPRPEAGAVVGRKILRSDIGFGHAYGEMKAVIFEKSRKKTAALLFVPDAVEKMNHFPCLIESDGNPEVSPGDLLTHDTKVQNVGSCAASLLRQGERPQTEPAALFENFPREALFGIGDPLPLPGDRTNLLLGELVRKLLERALGLSESEVQGSPPSDGKVQGGLILNRPF